MQLIKQENHRKDLSKSKNISALLAAATCTLLGSQAMAETDTEAWQIDTALLYYGETDRVTAVE